MLVLYSDGCRVCRWFARFLVKWDDTIDVVPIRHPLSDKWLGHLSIEERIANWWVVSGGTLYASNKGGALQLLKWFRFTRPLGLLIEALTLGWVVDRLDDWIKVHRPLIAKWLEDGEAPLKYEQVRD